MFQRGLGAVREDGTDENGLAAAVTNCSDLVTRAVWYTSLHIRGSFAQSGRFIRSRRREARQVSGVLIAEECMELLRHQIEMQYQMCRVKIQPAMDLSSGALAEEAVESLLFDFGNWSAITW